MIYEEIEKGWIKTAGTLEELGHLAAYRG